LVYVCDYEERVFRRMSEQERDSIEKSMLETVKQIEAEFESRADHIDYL
jgi:hypothetical protein